MYIVAYDPGKTTGYAILDTLEAKSERLYDYGEIDTSEGRGLDHVERKLRALKPGQIICESFVHRHVTGANYTAVEVIGILRKTAFQLRTPFLLQNAAVKQFWDNNKLKMVEHYVPGKPHCNDAIRHALYYDSFILKHQYWLTYLNFEETHDAKREKDNEDTKG